MEQLTIVKGNQIVMEKKPIKLFAYCRKGANPNRKQTNDSLISIDVDQ